MTRTITIPRRLAEDLASVLSEPVDVGYSWIAVDCLVRGLTDELRQAIALADAVSAREVDVSDGGDPE